MSYKYKYGKLVKLDKVFFNNFLRFFVEWWQVLWYWHLTIIESLYSLSVVLIWLYLTESGLVFFPYSMMMTIQEQQRKKKKEKMFHPCWSIPAFGQSIEEKTKKKNNEKKYMIVQHCLYRLISNQLTIYLTISISLAKVLYACACQLVHWSVNNIIELVSILHI